MTVGIDTSSTFTDARVKAVFDAYPAGSRAGLLKLRGLILNTASTLEAVGAMTETLKWGQPAYLPARPKVGTTVRIDARKNAEQGYAMYVHCQTTLVDQFRELYPDLCTYEGNRALLFGNDDHVDRAALAHCIALALTYHLNSN